MLLFCAICIVCATRLALYVSITRMAPQNVVLASSANECLFNVTRQSNVTTIKAENFEFDWSEKLQGFILSSIFIGMFLFQLPTGIVAAKNNPKHVMLLAMGTNSLLTFLIPICVHGSNGAIILVIFRIIIGAAEGTILPAFSVLLTAWFPAAERTRSLSFVVSGANVNHIQ